MPFFQTAEPKTAARATNFSHTVSPRSQLFSNPRFSYPAGVRANLPQYGTELTSSPRRCARPQGANVAVSVAQPVLPVSGEKRSRRLKHLRHYRGKMGGSERPSACMEQIVVSPMVLEYQCLWDFGTVAVRRGVPVKCPKREGVYPGAIRINGERARPLALDAYLT